MSAETVEQKERESRRAERSRRSEREDRDDRDDRDDDRPRKRRVEEEPTPVVSGRFLIAAGFVLAMVVIPLSQLGSFFEPKDPTVPQPSTWTVGSRATVAITLITADYNLLSCAHDKTYKAPEGSAPKPIEYHCANKSESEPWPRDPSAPLDDNKASVIQPYRTWLNNQLILVGGLWATPQLALRLHSEPAAGIDKDKLARFVVECDVTFIGKMDGVKLRWGPGQWVAPDMAPMLAHPNSCKITEQ